MNDFLTDKEIFSLNKTKKCNIKLNQKEVETFISLYEAKKEEYLLENDVVFSSVIPDLRKSLFEHDVFDEACAIHTPYQIYMNSVAYVYISGMLNYDVKDSMQMRKYAVDQIKSICFDDNKKNSTVKECVKTLIRGKLI